MGGLGCHAQTPPAGQAPAPLSAQMTRRIETLVRLHFDLPPDVVVHVGPPTVSALNGYQDVAITITQGITTSPQFIFEISNDGKVFGRFEKYDLSQDPINITGRPVRGAADAPVTIVSFDDLECPYCSQMHATLFPETLNHYAGKLRIIYKDFPLTDIHPWAMHAAVDANCLAAQSDTGYWNFVDYVHAHGTEISGTDKTTTATAFATLDKLATDEGTRQKVNLDGLKACVAGQDTAAVHASMEQGRELKVEATPTLFVDGRKIDGAVPKEDLWKVIDNAMAAAGVPPAK